LERTKPSKPVARNHGRLGERTKGLMGEKMKKITIWVSSKNSRQASVRGTRIRTGFEREVAKE